MSIRGEMGTSVMKIVTEKIALNTKGDPDLINITDKIKDILDATGLKHGQVTVFVIGSTAAIATFEYEPGLIKDISEFYEQLIPKKNLIITTIRGAMLMVLAIFARPCRDHRLLFLSIKGSFFWAPGNRWF